MRQRIAKSVCILTASSALVVGIACSGKKGPHAESSTTSGVATRATTESAGGSVDLGGTNYEVAPLTAMGKLTGTVTFADSSDSSASNDSSATSANDTAEVKCVEPRGNRRAKANRLSRVFSKKQSRDTTKRGVAVVWVAGIQKGKPLDEEKRVDLASEHCALDPSIMAVPVGTTVNVINEDKALHTLVFTREGTHDTLTRMPFFNAGQLVASERLAKMPGIVDVICLQHPWTRATIAVFAHPYYAVTDNSGRFAIDSLPPGTYDVMMWSPGLTRPKQRRVSIAAGGTATASF